LVFIYENKEKLARTLNPKPPRKSDESGWFLVDEKRETSGEVG
jgi:hypothetical protein